jgi:homoserine dehydrogenase
MTALPSIQTSGPALVPAPLCLRAVTPDQARDGAGLIYRQIRAGRSVTVQVAGGTDALARLEQACRAIGLSGLDLRLLEGPADLSLSPLGPLPGHGGPLRVALAGCGVVGGGVLPRLLDRPDIALAGVLVRDAGKVRTPGPAPELVVTDPAALLAREPDVVIDTLSDASVSLAVIRAALSRGVHVVSASKQAVAADVEGLSALATGTGATLRYSAAVGGGVPMLETVRQARALGPVRRIEAVLNGTVNFLLNRLAAGQPFEEALAEAQAAGFAEADPSADLTGRDAAAKLFLLARVAFGPGAALPERVEALTADFTPRGEPVRQLAVADCAGGRITLSPVGDDPLFAGLADAGNAIRVTLADGRTLTQSGLGAGRRPTAESVWADLGDLLASRVGAGAGGDEL